MIVTCARCLMDWHLTELGSGVVYIAGDFWCRDEAACDQRIDELEASDAS